MSKILKIIVKDTGNNYENAYLLFVRCSVTVVYWKSIVPPNTAEFIIGPLTDQGVKNWVSKFEENDIEFTYETKEYTRD